jgi:N-acetylmuramoyl-L-alanine amidase
MAVLAVAPAIGQTQPPKPAVAAPSKVAVVVLDPAHGGSDSGARGSGTIESDVVLDFGRAIRVALEAKGFRAVLTREGNQSPSFDDRSALVNSLPDAVFVSLHVSSTGPAGTARAYFASLPPAPSGAEANPAQAPVRRPPGLVDWHRAQEPYLDSSRRLAELVQIQLAQQFQGSPEIPSAAAVRQLRTVAAPAIAIEISSVASGSSKLSQMGQPLGEALARAAAAFQQSLTEGSAQPGSAR